MTQLSRHLFLSIISLFLLFAGAFLLYQNRREKAFKTTLLNQRLQDYNAALGDFLHNGAVEESAVQGYLLSHPVASLRLTLLDSHGFVLFDNQTQEYPNLSDHRSRKEIREAMDKGSGYCIERRSVTVDKEYFYSATYFPEKDLIIRSALPYDDRLPLLLKADYSFLWFAAILMAALVLVLYAFSKKVAGNVSRKQDLESLELQKQLTQNISHELKTPLSGIRAYLETLHLHPEMPEETRSQFIERSCALARRLADLTEDLNTLDAAERVVLREELNVADILLQVLQDTGEDFREKRMALETDFPESIPLVGDRKLLYSLFRNLVDNSLRYAGEGSTVYIRARKEGKSWHFVFSDNGPGVPEESLPHLYERFFRTDKGRSRELGGTGLGLSIVREAVRLHGGDIRAHALTPHGLQHRFVLS